MLSSLLLMGLQGLTKTECIWHKQIANFLQLELWFWRACCLLKQSSVVAIAQKSFMVFINTHRCDNKIKIQSCEHYQMRRLLNLNEKCAYLWIPYVYHHSVIKLRNYSQVKQKTYNKDIHMLLSTIQKLNNLF